MKYEDLKCEFCDGQGEKEKFVEPYGDSPVICTFCNGTGIDQNQLNILINAPKNQDELWALFMKDAEYQLTERILQKVKKLFILKKA